jgi:hypothetical protein
VQLLDCWPDDPAEAAHHEETPHHDHDDRSADQTLDLTIVKRRRPTGYCRLISTTSHTITPSDHTRTAALISSLQRQLLDLATR